VSPGRKLKQDEADLEAVVVLVGDRRHTRGATTLRSSPSTSPSTPLYSRTLSSPLLRTPAPRSPTGTLLDTVTCSSRSMGVEAMETEETEEQETEEQETEEQITAPQPPVGSLSTH
jgi:hypothetical protein